jgi:hypothetical protein
MRPVWLSFKVALGRTAFVLKALLADDVLEAVERAL